VADIEAPVSRARRLARRWTFAGLAAAVVGVGCRFVGGDLPDWQLVTAGLAGFLLPSLGVVAIFCGHAYRNWARGYCDGAVACHREAALILGRACGR